MSRIPALAAAALAIASTPTLAAEHGKCKDVPNWADVPSIVRARLETAMGPVAERGQEFNATDVIRSGLASNRFLAACQTGDFVSIAIERGGRGYHIEVFHYVAGNEVRRWSEFVGRDHKAVVNLLEPSHER